MDMDTWYEIKTDWTGKVQLWDCEEEKVAAEIFLDVNSEDPALFSLKAMVQRLADAL